MKKLGQADLRWKTIKSEIALIMLKQIGIIRGYLTVTNVNLHKSKILFHQSKIKLPKSS